MTTSTKRFTPFAGGAASKNLSARQKLEREVMQGITGLLRKYGWRAVRTAYVRGICGEPGMSDKLFLRYMDPNGAALALWIEFKREKRGKLGDDQKRWHANERLRGGLVMQFSSVKEFDAWYTRKFGWLPHAAGQGALDLSADSTGSSNNFKSQVKGGRQKVPIDTHNTAREKPLTEATVPTPRPRIKKAGA